MRRMFLLVLIVLIVTLTGNAQDYKGDYKIHVDDVLIVSVWGHPEFEREVLVGPDGTISVPLAGKIDAVGKTVDEITEILNDKLKETLLDPDVNVALKQYRRLEVLVLGEIARPGDYELSFGSRLLTAISRAGGPTEKADINNLRLTRADTSFDIDLERVMADSDTANNLELKDGDVIYLPSGFIEVTLMGEIEKPGRYEMRTGSRVLNAISTAGGPTEAAQTRELELNRGDESFTVDLESVLRGVQIEDNRELQDGDILFLPGTRMEVTILGEVRQQGMYELKEGVRLSDLLARSGGLLESASQTATIESNGRMETVELEEVFSGGFNPVLNEGDTVYISRTEYRVAVIGEVNQPGTYPWHSDLRLAELISKAGNVTEAGNKENVTIIRGEGEIQTVDLKNYMEGFAEADNPFLEAGDMVIVTEEDAIDWEQIFFFISGLNTLKQLLGLDW